MIVLLLAHYSLMCYNLPKYIVYIEFNTFIHLYQPIFKCMQTLADMGSETYTTRYYMRPSTDFVLNYWIKFKKIPRA